MIDYSLVIIKGLIEQNDPGAYFGSTLSLSIYNRQSINRGLIFQKDQFTVEITDFGKKVYRNLKLDTFPKQGRAYMWNKPKFEFPYEPDIKTEKYFNDLFSLMKNDKLTKTEKKNNAIVLLRNTGFCEEIIKKMKKKSWDEFSEEIIKVLKEIGYVSQEENP